MRYSRLRSRSRWIWAALLLGAAGVEAQDPPVRFSDVSAAFDFVHRSNVNGGNGLSGAAWFDYNRDGRLDAFIPNGLEQDNGLFRNDGNGLFTNVAAAAGVRNGQGNAGVIAADFDNDGFSDLFLTGEQGRGAGFTQQPAVLYRNLGNGTFEDVTGESGIAWPSAHRSASAADIDNDGLLDLVIAGNTSSSVQANRVLRNLGGMRFEDVTATAGLDRRQSTCATMFSDYDNDGDQDFFDAGCTVEVPLQLFENDGQGRFENVTQAAGFDTDALFMGLCGADYDHDGDTDVFVTNYASTREDMPHALYRNNGDGSFTDVAPVAGVADHEFGWGCAFVDFDNDGWDDLFFTGSLDTVCQPGVGGCLDTETIGPGRGNPGSLFFGSAKGAFDEFTHELPIDLSNDYSSGVVHGDYDGNGFSDLLIIREEVPAHNGRQATSGRPVLLRNQGNDNHFAALELMGVASNRDAIGARVSLTANGMTQSREVYAGSSHLSSESKRLIFGLGGGSEVEAVVVSWPAGGRELYSTIKLNELSTLIEGQGQPLIATVEGAWLNPQTPGEGLLIDYLSGPGLLFVAWFTYTLIPVEPAAGPPQDVGATGQRWLTATLNVDGLRGTGALFSSAGGAFDAPPTAFEATTEVGRLEVEFFECDRATLSYELDGVVMGSFEINPLEQVVSAASFGCVPFPR